MITRRLTLQISWTLLGLALLASPVDVQAQDNPTPLKLTREDATRLHVRNAANCTDRDWSDRMGPVRDQGDVGWCYANAAADLLGAKLNLQTSSPLSAALMALQYNYYYSDDSTAEAGVVAHALEKAMVPRWKSQSELELLATGMCPNSVEAEALQKSHGASLKQKLDALVKLKTDYDKSRSSPLLLSQFEAKLDRLAREGSIVGKLERQRLMNTLAKSTPKTFLLYFADLLCGNQRFYSSSTTTQVVHRARETTWVLSRPGKPPLEVTTQQDVFEDVDAELNRGNVVAVNYFVDFLRDGRSEPYTADEFHASVIVGRRWRNNSCQYLVRNSWGPECEQKDKDGKIRSVYSPLATECRQGNIWVAEKHLRVTTESVSFLIEGNDRRAPKPPKRSAF
ncbi:MAG: hypothetical protein NDI61_08180 [Bdellovibrionaceae bacterium]|nr:hypothetical protein [Pseudobdellovibrionaceae bacterium]